MTFCLPPRYRENPGPVYFHDVDGSDITFQPDVLPYAADLCTLAGLVHIVDIGCGLATKLAALHDAHPDWRFTGIDFGPNLDYCRENYPWGTWVERDLENAFHLDARDSVIVCSDVIEHLVDPRMMLATIRHSHTPAAVFSTPAREVQYPKHHKGPPQNLCHVREWSTPELGEFLTQEGFRVEYLGLTRGNDKGPALSTTLAVAVPT